MNKKNLWEIMNIYYEPDFGKVDYCEKCKGVINDGDYVIQFFSYEKYDSCYICEKCFKEK